RSLPALELTHQGCHLLVERLFHVSVVGPVTRHELLRQATEGRGGQVCVGEHNPLLVCHPVASFDPQTPDSTPEAEFATSGRTVKSIGRRVSPWRARYEASS